MLGGGSPPPPAARGGAPACATVARRRRGAAGRAHIAAPAPLHTHIRIDASRSPLAALPIPERGWPDSGTSIAHTSSAAGTPPTRSTTADRLSHDRRDTNMHDNTPAAPKRLCCQSSGSNTQPHSHAPSGSVGGEYLRHHHRVQKQKKMNTLARVRLRAWEERRRRGPASEGLQASWRSGKERGAS